MKVQIPLFAIVMSAVLLAKSSYGQSTQANVQKFTFTNAVEFLRLHTGIGSEAFDEKSFKYHANVTIGGTKVSGMYLATLAGDDQKLYEFFIRTDNVESTGTYKIFQVAGCLTQKPGNLSNFRIQQGECTCKISDDKNFVLRARDVSAIF